MSKAFGVLRRGFALALQALLFAFLGLGSWSGRWDHDVFLRRQELVHVHCIPHLVEGEPTLDQAQGRAAVEKEVDCVEAGLLHLLGMEACIHELAGTDAGLLQLRAVEAGLLELMGVEAGLLMQLQGAEANLFELLGGEGGLL